MDSTDMGSTGVDSTASMESTRKTARLAGLLYVLSSIPGAFGLIYVPGKLMVRGDAMATAESIRASEALLRAGVAAELLASALFIFVVLVLYRLFRPVARGPARAMMILFLISVPISCWNVLNEIAAMKLARGDAFLSAVGASQRDALAYFFLDMHREGFMVAQIFWGLWLFPFAICVMRSGFIPRFLGILLMIAGTGYIASSAAHLVLPQGPRAVGQVAAILTLAEMPIIFWLLIWGAKPRPQPA